MSTPTADAPGPYTWDDFVALDEDDPRELIDGKLIDIEDSSFAHTEIIGWLVHLLQRWSEAGHGGTVRAGQRLRFSDDTGVSPDVVFYRQGNAAVDATTV